MGGWYSRRKVNNALVIELGRVDLLQDLAIAFPQRFQAHLGDDVGRAIHVIARHFIHQAAFLFHALVQARSRRRLQQPHHGRHDAALLDEIDLLLKDRGRIVVKADDEPALHLETGALEPLDALHQVAALVLGLAAFDQAVFVGRLDADKHRVEPGLRHEPEQLRIVGQVDGRFGVERHADLALAPFDQRRQHLGLDLLLVADKVVVHEKDALAPAQRIEAVQLGDDLRGGLGARAMPQQRRHIAEVAIEGTASGELDADRVVMLEIRQLPKRHRGLLDVREFGRGVDRVERTRWPGLPGKAAGSARLR